mgnify:CR=1 FL=1
MNVFRLTAGEGPLVAAAIHNGHLVRPEVVELLSLSDTERLREEDPFTDSLANYDLFYATAEAVLRRLVATHGRVVVLDVHTYNHRRDGADGPLADADANPEVNVGASTMDRARWAAVVDGFLAELANFDYLGR